jgi:predicted RNase H-like nuclease (RuvC/YqgF family)
MVKALKTENEDNEKLIESLQNQIRTLTAECSQLSADSRRYESRTEEAELMKAHIERDLYKNLYEQAIERMIG